MIIIWNYNSSYYFRVYDFSSHELLTKITVQSMIPPKEQAYNLNIRWLVTPMVVIVLLHQRAYLT